MQKLFEDIPRHSLDLPKHNYDSYLYIHQSARAEVEEVRNLLNTWFDDILASEKGELIRRFKTDFDSSFYELFLFQLFKKLGFEISFHPDVPNSSKKPDFLLKKDGIEIYAEAKISRNKSEAEESIEKKINTIYDNLNKIRPKGFLLKIEELRIKTKKQPSSKKIVKELKEQIEKLDHDTVTRLTLERKLKPIIYEDHEVYISIKPIPVISEAKEIVFEKPIGIYPIEFFQETGEEALKNSILKKAKRYGTLDKPFIVCINMIGDKIMGNWGIENIIWGSTAISFSKNPLDKGKVIRQPDGVFLNHNGVRLKNLSGIFVTRVFPYSIADAKYWLFEHPFTENKLDFNFLGLKSYYVKDNKIVINEGDDIAKILDIV